MHCNCKELAKMADAKQAEKTFSDRLEASTAELRDALGKLRLAARGAVSRVEENSSEWVDELVKTGEKTVKEREKAAKKAARSTTKQETTLEQARARLAGYLGLPTQDEVEKLNKKLNSLTRKVNKLEKSTKGA
jgi:polyhydroxyalkanoate synthesis regulator phasin